jgi:hypothetical protein
MTVITVLLWELFELVDRAGCGVIIINGVNIPLSYGWVHIVS